MSEEISDKRRARVAIVGSGPSGFYAAEALFNGSEDVHVDMFERLPVPYGLVRYGVAPDHQKIKNVIRIYEMIAQNPRFRFFGNIRVGEDVSLEELHSLYPAVILACGAQTDRRLGIPGEDLAGSYTATEFVAWYNGHPDFVDRKFDLSGERAVVIGQGNVAVDVCRILAKTPDELKDTDITAYALEALGQSRIKEIHMVGRRGPAQAAFTPVEVREFGRLSVCQPRVSPEDLPLNPESEQELKGPEGHLKAKNYAILKEYAEQERDPSKPKQLFIHFFRSPVELRGEANVQTVIFEKNRLEGTAGAQKARGTGERFEFPCDAFFRSVGYRGVPLPGVPFDDHKGIIPNQEGRVVNEAGEPVSGLYCAGWIKRGPSGVIGTNKADSQQTVAHVLEDWPSLIEGRPAGGDDVGDFLKAKGCRPVTFEEWKKIDAAEIERGASVGKPREKFVRVEEMLAVLE